MVSKEKPIGLLGLRNLSICLLVNVVLVKLIVVNLRFILFVGFCFYLNKHTKNLWNLKIYIR